MKAKIFTSMMLFALIASSFKVEKKWTASNHKKFTTFYCNQRNVTGTISGGTETLSIVSFTLSAANNNANTVASITDVHIEGTVCDFYTFNSLTSGDFIRVHTNFIDYWKARNISISYSGTNGNGTISLNEVGFADGGLECSNP